MQENNNVAAISGIVIGYFFFVSVTFVECCLIASDIDILLPSITIETIFFKRPHNHKNRESCILNISMTFCIVLSRVLCCFKWL